MHWCKHSLSSLSHIFDFCKCIRVLAASCHSQWQTTGDFLAACLCWTVCCKYIKTDSLNYHNSCWFSRIGMWRDNSFRALVHVWASFLKEFFQPLFKQENCWATSHCMHLQIRQTPVDGCPRKTFNLGDQRTRWLWVCLFLLWHSVTWNWWLLCFLLLPLDMFLFILSVWITLFELGWSLWRLFLIDFFYMSSNVKACGTDTTGGGRCGFRKHSPTSKLFRVLFMVSELMSRAWVSFVFTLIWKSTSKNKIKWESRPV